MSRTKRLILTFDGFGTLFTPREPIAKSYADAARKYGLSGFTDDEIGSSFREAYKCQSNIAPNYGKRVGLNAVQWWSQVRYPSRLISSCFPYLYYIMNEYS